MCQSCSMFVQYNATCMTSSCFLLQLTHLWQDCNIIIFCCKRVDILVQGYQLSEEKKLRQVGTFTKQKNVAALTAQFNQIGEKKFLCAAHAGKQVISRNELYSPNQAPLRKLLISEGQHHFSVTKYNFPKGSGKINQFL